MTTPLRQPGAPSDAAPPERSSPRRRMLVGVVDQAVSSVTNVAPIFVVAARADTTELGWFAIAIAFVQTVVVVVRAMTAEPLVIRYTDADRRGADGGHEFATAVGRAVGFGIVVTGLASAVLLVAGLVFHPALAAAAAALPGIVAFEVWRHAHLARRRPEAALGLDLLWLTGAAASLVALGRPSASTALLAWGWPAAAIAVAARARSRTRTRFSPRAWVRATDGIPLRLGLEQGIEAGSTQLILVVLAARLDIAAVGAFQATRSLFGPLAVLFVGAVLAGVPEAVRMLRRDPRVMLRFCSLVSVTLALGCVGFGGLLLALPTDVGRAVLGDVWPDARALVPAFVALNAALGAVQGGRLGLRALGRAEHSLRIRAVQAPVAVAAAVYGLALHGAAGMVFGMAAATAVGAVFWRRALRRALRTATTTIRPEEDA